MDSLKYKKVYCIKTYKVINKHAIVKGNYYYIKKINNNVEGDWYSIHISNTAKNCWLANIKKDRIQRYFIDDIKYKIKLLLKNAKT